jgi:hypothetical protein
MTNNHNFPTAQVHSRLEDRKHKQYQHHRLVLERIPLRLLLLHLDLPILQRQLLLLSDSALTRHLQLLHRLSILEAPLRLRSRQHLALDKLPQANQLLRSISEVARHLLSHLRSSVRVQRLHLAAVEEESLVRVVAQLLVNQQEARPLDSQQGPLDCHQHSVAVSLANSSSSSNNNNSSSSSFISNPKKLSSKQFSMYLSTEMNAIWFSQNGIIFRRVLASEKQCTRSRSNLLI